MRVLKLNDSLNWKQCLPSRDVAYIGWLLSGGATCHISWPVRVNSTVTHFIITDIDKQCHISQPFQVFHIEITVKLGPSGHYYYMASEPQLTVTKPILSQKWYYVDLASHTLGQS